jgi:hypothetical protein
MEGEFKIKYLGEASFLLGMKLNQIKGSLILHQSQSIEQKLSDFNVSHLHHATVPLDPKSHLQMATDQEIAQLANLSVSYRALIGLLNYLSVLTQPDILYAVNKLPQFLDQPGICHYTAAIQVFMSGLWSVRSQSFSPFPFVLPCPVTCPVLPCPVTCPVLSPVLSCPCPVTHCPCHLLLYKLYCPNEIQYQVRA